MICFSLPSWLQPLQAHFLLPCQASQSLELGEPSPSHFPDNRVSQARACHLKHQHSIGTPPAPAPLPSLWPALNPVESSVSQELLRSSGPADERTRGASFLLTTTQTVLGAQMSMHCHCGPAAFSIHSALGQDWETEIPCEGALRCDTQQENRLPTFPDSTPAFKGAWGGCGGAFAASATTECESPECRDGLLVFSVMFSSQMYQTSYL